MNYLFVYTSRENKLHELCQDLVSRLKGRCQFVEAAEILSNHLGDMEESIAVLVQGRLWSEAIWSSIHYRRPDMIGKYTIDNFIITIVIIFQTSVTSCGLVMVSSHLFA
jgi:hypothetical protein